MGGKTVAWKHGGIEKELADAQRAMKTLGGRLAGVYPVRVSGLTDNRVVVVAKVSASPFEFPRRPGLPAKRPL